MSKDRSEYFKAYRDKNRELIREKSRARRWANREKDLERKRVYYRANKDKWTQYSKDAADWRLEYRKKNKIRLQEKSKIYRQKDRMRNPVKYIAWHRERAYNISFEDQTALFQKQDEACAICKTKLDFCSSHLDHNHTTGTVRGFLCKPCNTLLGFARESISILEAAVQYLKQDQNQMFEESPTE